MQIVSAAAIFVTDINKSVGRLKNKRKSDVPKDSRDDIIKYPCRH